jgi:hypothetical protein
MPTVNTITGYRIPLGSVNLNSFTPPGQQINPNSYISSYRPRWTCDTSTKDTWEIVDDDAYFNDFASGSLGTNADYSSAPNAPAAVNSETGATQYIDDPTNSFGGGVRRYNQQAAAHVIAVPDTPGASPVLLVATPIPNTFNPQQFMYIPVSTNGTVDLVSGETYTFFHPNHSVLTDPAPSGYGFDLSAGGDLADDNTPPGQLPTVSTQGSFATGTVLYSQLLCFTHGTQIDTPNGPVAVETLSKGDLVTTLDHGVQAIQWAGRSMFSHAALTEKENLRPIVIKAGALGDGMPARDMAVSPQHRVLVRSDIAKSMFGHDEVFVAAKHLCAIDGIDVMAPNGDVEYFHVLFDNHNVLLSNGALTESFYTGPWALKSISEKARQEIFALYPEIQEEGYKPVSARPLTTPKEGRELAERHKQAGVALVRKDAIKTSAA